MQPLQANLAKSSAAPAPPSLAQPSFWKPPFWKPVLLMLALACALLLCPSRASAQTSSRQQRMIAQLDRLLAGVKPGQTVVYIDDMGFRVDRLRAYRDHLASGTRAAYGVVDLWTSGVVPYSYASGLEDWKKTKFEEAIAIWEDVANVNFVVRGSQSNYIVVRDGGDIMNSSVGMIGGAQTLNFADWGTTYNAVHELGHALSALHEHTRSDRETYVSILYENIIDSKEHNFDLVPDSINRGPYDFDSVMHYSQSAFAINSGDITIQTKAGYTEYQTQMGQRNHLSDLDIAGMISRYGAGPHPVRVVWNTNNSGSGSLRQAIADANAKPGTTIRFRIYTTDPGFSGGVFTIRPTSALPAITANNTVIDATTQTNFQDTNASGPEIVLNGSLAPSGVSGLRLSAASCLVKGMTVNGFTVHGIEISGTTATSNRVEGCYIGTTSSGLGKSANAYNGVFIGAGADFNAIGGTATSARNVISGNTQSGVRIYGAGTTNNLVSLNYIGLNATGTSTLGNSGRGVLIEAGATGNTIGGTSSSRRNFISGNTLEGVFIYGSGTNSNLVKGNYIGLNATGDAARPNADGVAISGGAQSNTIGGTELGARNVIAGNTDDGVVISSTDTTGNTVAGNHIGVKAGTRTATLVFANGGDGVLIQSGAQTNTIGGTTVEARNVISGNGSDGVEINGSGTNSNGVYGNYIGVSILGSSAVANLANGVYIYGGAQSNSIGGFGGRNVISGNGSDGVEITGSGTNSNGVYSNTIGLNAAGTAAAKNGGRGVYIYGGAQLNIVGRTLTITLGGITTSFSLGNVISGNTSYGVLISGAGTDNNTVATNYVGTNATGAAAVANSYGVYLGSGAKNNTVGGLTSGARNVISGNANSGVYLSASATTGNRVLGNYIGTNPSGTAALPNHYGVIVYAATSNSIGGTAAGSRNVISGNTYDGVYMSGIAMSNTVAGNYIGTNAAGTAALPNDNGVTLNAVSSNIIGGTASTAGNVIAYNRGNGVVVYTGSAANSIWRNSIFGNDDLGINLQPSGEAAATVTPNDPGDADTGPNGLQNFPVLTAATTNGSSVTIKGTLNSAASTLYRLEFFSSPTADPSGHGEGQTFLGALLLGTNASGDGSFSFTAATDVPAGYFITATATPTSNPETSEFSAALPVVPVTQESEPNEAPPDAIQLDPVGQPIAVATGAISPSGDVDFYKFTAPAGARLWACVDTGAQTSGDSVLTLIGPDGTTVLETDDDDGIGNGGDGSIESLNASAIAGRVLATAGTYYLKVEEFGNDGVLSAYRLYVAVTSGGPNETEADDTAATANLLVTATTPRRVRAGNISSAGDVDYYSVVAEAGNVLFVDADGDPERNGTGTDVMVDLIAPDGTTVLLSANSSESVSPNAEGFGFNIPASGTYFVRVQSASGGTGTYQVLAAVLGGGAYLSINDVSLTESNGATYAFFTVKLSHASVEAVTVHYATANGTAITPDDYTASSGTLTFDPGVTSRLIAVPVVGDTAVEPNETFTVNLTSPTNAVLLDAMGIGTIVNDDSAAGVAASSATSPSSAATPTVTLAGAEAVVSGQSVTLTFGGPLDATTAGEAARYAVTVNGAAAQVQSAIYDAQTNTVTLLLPDGALQAGDEVVVSWQGGTATTTAS